MVPRRILDEDLQNGVYPVLFTCIPSLEESPGPGDKGWFNIRYICCKDTFLQREFDGYKSLLNLKAFLGYKLLLEVA